MFIALIFLSDTQVDSNFGTLASHYPQTTYAHTDTHRSHIDSHTEVAQVTQE